MEKLVGDALELAWLDTERPSLPLEEVDVGRLWDVIRENAGFETGWAIERMPCELPADCRVLPSHGGTFHGLHRRLEELVGHHEQRLEATLEACAAPVPAVTVLRRLFRRDLDAHQMGFALGETLAHLNYLMHQGVVERWTTADGTQLYQAR